MKIFLFTMGLLIPFLFSCGVQKKDEPKPVRIIFDSDIGPDYDDVGAIALLHAFADSGKAIILATMASNQNELVGPTLDVINTYFGRPTIPIGAPKGKGVNLGCWQKWSDSITVKYPHQLKRTSDATDATILYRRILSKQDDKSVTIVTTGFLTNMGNLVESKPDRISPLSGQELIAKKVLRLVSMAGGYPKGKEFNMVLDSAASKITFDKWPTPVIFTGYEIGRNLFTGIRLIQMPVDNSPVKDVFRISIPQSKEDKNGRMSWDETAVLIAVNGTDNYFSTVKGKITVLADGSNTWENQPEGLHEYVVQKMPVTELSKVIEDLMMHLPNRAYTIKK